LIKSIRLLYLLDSVDLKVVGALVT
jgi:hypothetical protein